MTFVDPCKIELKGKVKSISFSLQYYRHHRRPTITILISISEAGLTGIYVYFEKKKKKTHILCDFHLLYPIILILMNFNNVHFVKAITCREYKKLYFMSD